jgi:hypothetical protein
MRMSVYSCFRYDAVPEAGAPTAGSNVRFNVAVPEAGAPMADQMR